MRNTVKGPRNNNNNNNDSSRRHDPNRLELGHCHPWTNQCPRLLRQLLHLRINTRTNNSIINNNNNNNSIINNNNNNNNNNSKGHGRHRINNINNNNHPLLHPLPMNKVLLRLGVILPSMVVEDNNNNKVRIRTTMRQTFGDGHHHQLRRHQLPPPQPWMTFCRRLIEQNV